MSGLTLSAPLACLDAATLMPEMEDTFPWLLATGNPDPAARRMRQWVGDRTYVVQSIRMCGPSVNARALGIGGGAQQWGPTQRVHWVQLAL